MRALVFTLLAAATASNFLETPTKPSIEASGVKKETIPAVPADDNSESDSQAATVDDEDDVQDLGTSDVDQQDSDVDEGDMSEESSPADLADSADTPTEMADGSDEEAADESATDEMPLAKDGASFLEHSDPLDMPDADGDDDADMAATGDDSMEPLKAMGDEEDESAVDNLDSPDEPVDDASSMAEELPTSQDSDDIMEQEVENLDMSEVSKAISNQPKEAAREPAKELPQTSKVSIKSEVVAAEPVLAKAQPKEKASFSNDAVKLFQPIRMQISDFKDKVYAGPKFKAKVASMCKKYSEVQDCDKTMKEFVFCKLLRSSEPKAADQLCAGVSMDLASYISGKKKIASLSSTGSNLQVGIVEEVAEKMEHDLEMNFDTIVSF
jgi:hypothetical protein